MATGHPGSAARAMASSGCVASSMHNATKFTAHGLGFLRMHPLGNGNGTYRNRKDFLTVKAQDGKGKISNVRIKIPEQGETLLVSDKSAGTSSSITPPFPPASSPYIGSPLLWVGVGVGLSALFAWASGHLKRYAMQQAVKTMMGQTGSMNSQFGAMPPFPFPAPPPMPPMSSTFSSTQPTEVFSTSPPSSASMTVTATLTEETLTSQKVENKKPAFTDVNLEAEDNKSKDPLQQKQEQQKEKERQQQQETSKTFFKDSENGSDGAATGWKPDGKASGSSGQDGSLFTVDMLEKMMEDPTVQQMVYPYLPEEMRNPSTFKWMLQNPEFRKQLQEMLNGMSDGGWKDGQMNEVLKNFVPNNQDLKEQFEQIGLTPEEVMEKMISNPDLALAFQNPKIQAALVDCSQNPANIAKYQDDKEVMHVFNKIAELFPVRGF